MDSFRDLRFEVQTDVGVVRTHNEDAIGVVEIDQPVPAILLIVADGMGGEAAGEVASRALVDDFEQAFDEVDGERLIDRICARIEATNEKLVKLAATDPSKKGMGSTIVVAAFCEDGSLACAHVGDSRVYMFRDGQLERITRDHSRVQMFVDGGILTPEQAEQHPESNVLTQAVGRENLTVDRNESTKISWRCGTFLVCSDGLTGMVPESVIAAAMESLPVDEIPDALIDECNRLGAKDNVSVGVIRDGEPEKPMGREEFHRLVPTLIAAHDEMLDDHKRKEDERLAEQQRLAERSQDKRAEAVQSEQQDRERISEEMAAEFESRSRQRRARIASYLVGVAVVIGLLAGGFALRECSSQDEPDGEPAAEGGAIEPAVDGVQPSAEENDAE